MVWWQRLLRWLGGHLMMKAIGLAVFAGLAFVSMKVYDAVSDQPERQEAAIDAADAFRASLLDDRFDDACDLMTKDGRGFLKSQHRKPCAAYLEEVAGRDGVLRPWFQCRSIRDVVSHTAKRHGFGSGEGFTLPFGKCEGDETNIGTLSLTEVDGAWRVSAMESSLLYE